MNDFSWMYWVSPEGLRRMDYYNRVESFINYALFNPRNISRGEIIRCPCKRCKKKKFLDPDIVTMHLLQKNGLWRNTCVGLHIEKPYVLYKIMVEKMVRSTSSYSNVYGVVDDNNNSYRNMVMDVIRMN
jgi:hypothetical protein